MEKKITTINAKMKLIKNMKQIYIKATLPIKNIMKIKAQK